MLECLPPLGKATRAVQHCPQIEGIKTWMSGARFEKPPVAPIVVEWNPDTPGFKKAFYDATVPLMHGALLQNLRACGVDNLDTYEAHIVDTVTGEVDIDYRAVNIIGAVAAADLAQSKYTDLSGKRRIDMDFDALTIAVAACRGALMFRLAQCVSGVVIHDQVRRRLNPAEHYGLTFVEPEQWIG